MKKLASLFLFLAVLTGCTTTQPVDVSTDFDRATNFGSLTTFKWYQDQPAAGQDPNYQYDSFIDQRMKRAVESELSRKGLRLVTSNPDILVAYDMKVETKQELRPDYSYAPGFGYGYGYWYGYRYNYGYSRFGTAPMLIDEYKNGTVIIDFVDPKDNQLAWRGWGQMEVGSANVTEAEINRITAKILSKYPPGSDK
jgi:hypothetical protein